MIKFYILIGVMVAIGLGLKFFTNNNFSNEKGDKKEEKKKPLYKYTRKNFLISRPEHEFFDILVEILGNKYNIFTQVHLPTILEHKVVGQNWKGAFSHINGKSVDFVICDKAYIKPLLAIELDDKSHEREDRIERDSEVERMLQEAGMPLVRFGNNGLFNKEEISRIVLEKLK
jgi:very-short-patch-repair endonuclease